MRSSSHTSSSRPSRRLLALAGGLVALALVVAACGTADGGPTPPPSSAPIVTPGPSAPASPSQPASGSRVELDTALGHDVVVDIADDDGLLAGARSGSAADGMSVKWGEISARNVDARTVEVTWAGYPRDETVELAVQPQGNGVLLRFGQQMPYPNTDAMGADRVLVLTFAEDVAADAVVAEFAPAAG